MPARDEIREALRNFICRVFEGNALDEHQVEVLRLYLEHYGVPQGQQRRVDQHLEEQKIKQEDKADFVFPQSGLLDARQVAQYLGLDFKHREAAVRRMGRDGRLPKPIPRTRGKKDYWREEDLREHCERLSA